MGKNTTNHRNCRGRRGLNKHTTISLIAFDYVNKRMRPAGEGGNNNNNTAITGGEDDASFVVVVMFCIIIVLNY